MTEDSMTTRDRVWSSALELAVARDSFMTKELIEHTSLESKQKATTLRTLKSLEQEGWLERENRHCSTWRPGWKVKLLTGAEVETKDPVEQEDKSDQRNFRKIAQM